MLPDWLSSDSHPLTFTLLGIQIALFTWSESKWRPTQFLLPWGGQFPPMEIPIPIWAPKLTCKSVLQATVSGARSTPSESNLQHERAARRKEWEGSPWESSVKIKLPSLLQPKAICHWLNWKMGQFHPRPHMQNWYTSGDSVFSNSSGSLSWLTVPP